MSTGLSDLDGPEVYRRLPTLELFYSSELASQTALLSARAPAYFWEVPASTSGYHHPACQQRHGLWVHTLMLSTVIDRLADSWLEQGRITVEQLDLAHAAAILHDQRKHGDPADPASKSVSDHELLMAEHIREHSELPAEVADAVESHMGPWYDGPSPETALEQLVHTADMLASTATISPAIQGPTPEELADLDISTVYLD